ncbi:hypothetical protein OIDMADRAFT_19578 [Oidiodendron maius Zn]|uniref:Uncharacterized protein n=1 Tax=Oidiodendron maius (strain Zn) TaxID=913774 RepID=A0A0C3HBF2_OIDMZ|nr:hypothetical protein OIDMADRAFT_19578 [Oidiodendron maius Zn]
MAGYMRGTARSYTRHAAVEIIAGILREERSSDILCYAQDPAYDNVDKGFLKHWNHTP